MSEQLVKVTDQARGKILEYMKKEERGDLALKMSIGGRGPGGVAYRLGFVTPDERGANDPSFDAGGFTMILDAASLGDLKGATIDFVEAAYGTGFKIDNPNPLWRDPVAAAVQKVLDEEINPAVGSHGGFVTLLDVQGDRAFVQFGGGCQGCGMVDVTLKQGVEARVKELVPAIREVVDTTDHAGGTNPYYRGAAGSSPVGR